MGDILKKKLDELIEKSGVAKEETPERKERLEKMVKHAMKIKDAILKDGEKAMTIFTSAESILNVFKGAHGKDLATISSIEMGEMLIATLILYEEKKIIKIL